MKKQITKALIVIVLLGIIGCGEGSSSSGVNVSPEAPVFVSKSIVTVKENQKDAITLEATDNLTNVDYDIYGGDANSFNCENKTGKVMFKDFPDFEKKRQYKFTAIAKDEAGNPTEDNITINIQDVDENDPIFVSSSNITVNENQKEALTLKATDESKITYSLSGSDITSFNFDNSTHKITFKNAPDYEKKSTYNLTAKAVDSLGNSATQKIKITIKNIDDSKPIITSKNSVSVEENQNRAITIKATDESTLSYNISGVDAYLFNTKKVDNSTFEITFKTKPDYESTKKTYTILVTVTDAKGYSTTQNITINILNVHDLESDYFITTWKTNNRGSSQSNQIKISSFGSKYKIDWGDGKIDFNVKGNILHTYNSKGIYTIKISGNFSNIDCSSSGDGGKLLSIEQWGNISWKSMKNAFWGCYHLVINAKDNPDLSNVTSLSGMFRNTSSFNQDIGSWDVSHIMDMSYLFSGATIFNQDIRGWNVSNVINMEGMFSSAESFNQGIGEWDVSSVENMSEMFRYAIKFNQNIGNWDVSNVTNMGYDYESSEGMFAHAVSFDQDISSWNMSNVQMIHCMFCGTKLSTTNYDKLLLGWSQQSLAQNIYFNSGNSKYSASAKSARQYIIDNFGWTINDGGEE